MDTHSPFSPFTFPHPARSLETSLLNITLPHSTGSTLQDEIQCYSIPYGFVGFISHLASYYTLAITAVGRRPLKPWRRLEKKNLILSALQLLGTMALATYTIYACHDRWQFVLIAVWKLLWNAEKAGWQMTAGWKVSKQQSIDWASRNGGLGAGAQIELAGMSGDVDRKSGNFLRSLAKWYGAAAIIGLVGIASLVKLAAHHTPHVLVITGVFGGIVAFLLALGIGIAIASICVEKLREVGVDLIFIFPLFAVIVLFALYSDWILGAIANNLLGNPQQNRAFYWAYLAFKHLALFMM